LSYGRAWGNYNVWGRLAAAWLLTIPRAQHSFRGGASSVPSPLSDLLS